MHADLESILCKFGSDLTICVGEEAICATVYRRTDDGRLAIVLKLISSKCIPIHLYGLESLSLFKYQLNSLDFTVNRIFMKLFRTNNKRRPTIATLQDMFGFALPSVRIAPGTEKFIKELTAHARS